MTEDKPATDGHYSSCAVHNMPAYPTGPCDCGLEDRLRATIDTERAARLAAEARVKVLTEALRRIDSLIPADCHLDGMADAALRGLLLMIGDQIAALKAREPANG